MRSLPSNFARFAILVLVSASFVHAEKPPSAKEERIKGTSVWMVRPAGFDLARRFPGFMDETRVASVVVTLLPTKPEELTESLTDRNLAQRGMKVLARTTDPEGAASKGLLLDIAQSQSGIDFRKWMFVFGSRGTTVMLVATYRAEDRDSLKKPLRASVLSARYDSSTAADPEADLPFLIGPSKQLTHRYVVGSSLSLSRRDFRGKPRAPEEPLFLVGPSLAGSVAPEARRSLFERRLRQTKGVRDLTPGPVGTVEIAGLRGLECVATGAHATDGTKAMIYQLMLFDDRGYFLIQGLTVPANRDRDLAEFKRLARTFRSLEKSADPRGGGK